MKNEKIEEINVLLDQVFTGIVPVQTSKMMIVMAIESLLRDTRKQLLDEIMEEIENSKTGHTKMQCHDNICICDQENDRWNVALSSLKEDLKSKYNK